MKKDYLQLMLVTNKGSCPKPEYLQFIEACLKAGVTCVQLREKILGYKQLLSFGYEIKRLCKSYKIPLIVNDNLKLCIELGADGLHLGQNDEDVIYARKLLGTKKTIGLSVNTIEQVRQSENLPIDYLGVGSIFATNNKPDVKTIWGLKGLAEVTNISSHSIIAIGGINEQNAPYVMRAGASGIAAIDAFHNSKNYFLTAVNLRKIINEGRHDR